MMLELKDYQEKALDTLRRYLRACAESGDADQSFYGVTRDVFGQGIPYAAIREPSELADIPYVCLRLPTGGGKTLLACHAIAEANREYLRQEHSIVLWLVPSNAIREQTVNALKDCRHPYRQALDGTLGPVTVMDLTEALFMQPAAPAGSTVVIVSTIQAFRVEDKEGRKVYSTDGHLQGHFADLPQGVQEKLVRDEDGNVVRSLANVLRLHRPLVIVDEAHNARTGLSFETLARFRPSAILEFTATPATGEGGSNVLHSVSAAELKAEHMIKLPIRLETHRDWQTLLADAIAQRNELEKKVIIEKQRTGDYIRPIMLIQAQPRRKGQETLSVEVVEKSLIRDHRIPEGHIARATGEDREIEGIDLRDEKCELRYIITVQALREGWDCPFAYVLCSVAEQHSTGAVEQILGRTLRLPYSVERKDPDLNRAYAFVTSPHFQDAAQSLQDALVENGFNRQEAREFITMPDPEQGALAFGALQRQAPARTIELKRVGDPKSLPPAIRAKIDVDAKLGTVTLKSPILPDEEEDLLKLCSAKEDQKALGRAMHEYREEVRELFKSPAERGERLAVPALCLRRDGQLEIFDEEHLYEGEWDLTGFAANLTDEEFETIAKDTGEIGEIDVGQDGKVGSRFIPQLLHELQVIESVEHWTDAQLIAWLDRNLPFVEFTAGEKGLFLAGLVGDILDRRGMPLAQAVRRRFEVRKIAETKIRAFRNEMRKRGHQEWLFGEGMKDVVVSPERCFVFAQDQYPAREVCRRSDEFLKHFYSKVGELSEQGEEFECALFIDRMEEVECWVRNLERQERLSFWLQTATDKFYPDFVCKLKDGRYLVVEFKGAHLWSSDDSKEKRRLGELWAEKSDEKCLFIMPEGKEFEAIKALVREKI